MTEPLLSVWVPGKPKTKGSMTVVNGRRGVLREGVAGSSRWRDLVHYCVAKIVVTQTIYPLDGPVIVDLLFVLPTDDVVRARSGDIDKLSRNILDALQDAGVYSDDVQVSELIARKASAGACEPGVAIRVSQ